MTEAEAAQENSSLRRKKPPWLKLDIPTIQLTLDDSPEIIQPVKRQGFPRSVSMPGENFQAALQSFNHLNIPHQNQPSITQTIKSEKRVRFERVNTVPPKGQRSGPRRVSTVRRRSCVPKLFTRRRSSIPKQIIRGTADWFGVSRDSDSTQRWRRKSLQHCNQLYGGLKAQVMREMDLPSQDNLSLASTETPPPLYLPPHHPHPHHGMQRVGRPHQHS